MLRHHTKRSVWLERTAAALALVSLAALVWLLFFDARSPFYF